MFTKPDKPPAPIDWNAYAGELRDFMRAPSSGMILNANDYFEGCKKETGRAAFKLSSCRFQREFVTLWELFDEREPFHRCVKMLAARAWEIYATTPFSVILTCTETSKCLMWHIHPSLDLGGDLIRPQYLGHYPYLGMENQATIDVEDRSVLLLTDVVAKGDLVKHLAEFVVDRGGTPVAALAVVLVDNPLIDAQQSSGESPFLTFGDSGRKVRMHSLTQYPIPALDQGDYDEDKIVKIDPVTVLPEEKLKVSQRFAPAFSIYDMYSHFEESEAIDFGYFESETGRYTTAVRIDRLLGRKGDMIWPKIHAVLKRQHLLDQQELVFASTFDREDMRFKEFVEDRYAQLASAPSSSFVFIPKRDSLESPKSYFLLPQKAEKLDQKHVVLLLARVHTAESLSSLSSLIATRSVESITAICLINRMGADTDGFVSRIEQVLRGLGVVANGHARFHFAPVYTISDLSGEDLTQTRDTIEAIFRTYRERTRVRGFTRWVDRAWEFAREQMVSSPSFSERHPTPLPMEIEFPWAGDGKTVSVRSHEGMLSVLCSYVVTKRDYAPLLDYAEHTERTDALLKLLPILLSDLSFLKNKGVFEDLRQRLIAKFRKYRDTRFAIERVSSSSSSDVMKIRYIIDREMDVLLVLCALAHLDELNSYAELIYEVVSCDKTAKEWLSCPLNLTYYHGYDRVAWTISMLLLLACPSLVATEFESKLKTELLTLVNELMNAVDGKKASPCQLPAPDSVLTSIAPEDRQKIKATLDLLLTELGVHERTEKHQLIRYLHSRILTLAQRHSPINSSLTDTFNALEAEISSSPSPSTGEGRRNRFVRIRNDGPGGLRLKVALDEAIYVTGVLQDVADAAARWFFVTPSRRAEIGRYMASPTEEGLARDAKSLGDFLQGIRTTGVFSTKDFEEASDLKNAIFFDLWDKHSPLRKELLRYVVPFSKILDEVLPSANTMLARADLPDVWLPKDGSASYRVRVRGLENGIAPEYECNVLIDPQLLKEVLKNVLYNVRYNLRNSRLEEGETLSDLVSAELMIERGPCPTPETGETEYVVFRVRSGRTPPRHRDLEKAYRESTFAQHRLGLGEFGGSLELDKLSNSEGAEVVLKLISRRGAIAPERSNMGGQET